MDGKFEPGMRLDYAILAKEIGVSSTPVREACSALESAGLVEHLPRYGMVVRKMTSGEVANLYELRELLECFAAERAAERRTETQLAELRRQCDNQQSMLNQMWRRDVVWSKAEIGAGWAVADVAFHYILLEASGNSELVRTAKQCHLLSQTCGLGFRTTVTEQEFRAGQLLTWWGHTRIYRAIQQRLPQEASRWMRWHLGGAKELMVGAAEMRHSFKAWPPGDIERVRRLEE